MEGIFEGPTRCAKEFEVYYFGDKASSKIFKQRTSKRSQCKKRDVLVCESHILIARGAISYPFYDISKSERGIKKSSTCHEFQGCPWAMGTNGMAVSFPSYILGALIFSLDSGGTPTLAPAPISQGLPRRDDLPLRLIDTAGVVSWDCMAHCLTQCSCPPAP